MQSPQVRPREIRAVPTGTVAASPLLQPAARVLQQPSYHPALIQHTAPLVSSSSVPATPAGVEFRAPRTSAEPVAAVQQTAVGVATATPGTEYRTIRLLRSDASAPTVAATPAQAEGRATRSRRSEPPPTPSGEHRELADLALRARYVPASPAVEYRASPAVQYRTIAPQTMTSSSGAQVTTTCMSPVVRMRTGGNAQTTPTASPTTTLIQTVQPAAQATPALASPRAAAAPAAPAPASPYVERRERHSAAASTAPAVTPQRGATPGHQNDCLQSPSVMRTISLLPPTPCNSLPSFLKGLATGEVVPALCRAPAVLDLARYYEKRRVQNILRRVLEALQNAFGMEGDAEGLANTVFDELLNRSRRVARGFVDEATFINGLDSMNAFPPELMADDRREVFAVFQNPVQTLRGLCHGMPMPKEIGRRHFVTALARLPYNLPDFPVPSHLVFGDGSRRVLAREVASQIAAHFYHAYVGHDKDFFLSGLISLEEIQSVLPRLLPTSVVEEAVKLVIAYGSAGLREMDWQVLVFGPRMMPEVPTEQPAPVPEPQPEPFAMPATPEQRYRTPLSPMPEGSSVVLTAAPSTPPSGGAAALGTPPPSQPAMQRDLRSEEPVTIQTCQRIINWSTCSAGRDAQQVVADHHADEGAGVRPQEPAPEAAAPGGEEEQAEVLRLISLDMHNECMGPFLALAFVKCCQNYEAHAPR